MSSPSPIVLAALAGGGLYLYSRAQKAKTAIVGVSSKKTADYFTPTDVAGMLGRLVVGITKNIDAPAPAGIFAVKSPTTAGSAESGLAGWETYGGYSVGAGGVDTGDPYNPWVGPSVSNVSVPTATRYGSSVDAVVAGPVYDPRTDFVNNPLFLSLGL